MDDNEAVTILKRLLETQGLEADNARARWHHDVQLSFRDIFGTESEEHRKARSFEILESEMILQGVSGPNAARRSIDQSLSYIQVNLERIQERGLPRQGQGRDAGQSIAEVLGRFHRAAMTFRDRQRNRAPFEISDEYDVQDLVHAMLRMLVDDVRPEEVSPSLAGSSSRIDFVLPQFRMAVETKMTRKGLGNKEISRELFEDAARYRKHPDVGDLVCLVYDPEEKLKNPDGFVADLSVVDAELTVRVVVAPGR